MFPFQPNVVLLLLHLHLIWMTSHLLHSPLSMGVSDVLGHLAALRTHKPPGLNGVCNRLLKECASSIAAPLCHVFNLSLAEGIFPSVWKRASITPYTRGRVIGLMPRHIVQLLYFLLYPRYWKVLPKSSYCTTAYATTSYLTSSMASCQNALLCGSCLLY